MSYFTVDDERPFEHFNRSFTPGLRQERRKILRFLVPFVFHFCVHFPEAPVLFVGRGGSFIIDEREQVLFHLWPLDLGVRVLGNPIEDKVGAPPLFPSMFVPISASGSRLV